MNILKYSYFAIEPQSALRSTQTQNWLTKITEEKAQALENEFEQGFDRKGKAVWFKVRKDGKTVTLRSKPNYVRTKRYLDKYFEYKEKLQVIAAKTGFTMPQDAFFMWFFMPMPKTWTKKKKAQMAFKMHKNKKDTDNLSKGIKDALCPRKSNFLTTQKKGIDDRIISSYANAKIYIPDDFPIEPGILIVEYDIYDFLLPFWADAMNCLGIIQPVYSFVEKKKAP